MTGALEALNEVLFAHLRGSAIWGERVEPLTIASSSLAKPYTAFFYAGGGREQVTPSRDNARLTISVKVVALTLATALAGQEAITDLLHNAGRQDVNPRLPFHTDWDILTVTEDRVIYIEDKFSGAQSIYHAGHQYMFVMERK